MKTAFNLLRFKKALHEFSHGFHRGDIVRSLPHGEQKGKIVEKRSLPDGSNKYLVRWNTGEEEEVSQSMLELVWSGQGSFRMVA